MMSVLTPEEAKWLKRVQRALGACPSDRLAFYTTGDNNVTVYDNDKIEEIDAIYDSTEGRGEFCNAVEDAGAELGQLIFPGQVASTAG